MKKILYILLITIFLIINIGCSDSKNIATVNGVEITRDEYNKFIDILSATNNYANNIYIQEANNDIKEKEESSIDSMVISFMIDNEILYQEAKDKANKPSGEEVKLKYDEIESLINNNIKYEKEMKKVDFDKEFLLKQVYKDMIIQSYRDNFEKNLKISNEDIKDYYEKNKDKFKVKEIEASHILISTLDNDNKEVDISKKEALKKKAESIQAQVNSCENFEELAKKYSDDKSTGQYGGKLGFFSKNDKNIEFTNEAFKLEKGDVSNLIETSYGYHIIKVTDKRDVQEGLEENKDIIKKEILNETYIDHIIELNKKAEIKK